MPLQKTAVIVANTRVQGDYFLVDFQVPEIPGLARPGQFVHLQIPGMEGHLLRRPFSIYDTDPTAQRLSVLYKTVGVGSLRLSQLPAGTAVDMLGPQGNGFSPLPQEGAVLVAGGYGAAALFGLAKNAVTPPACLIGGRTQRDLLLQNEYRGIGCDCQVSTDDGSYGLKGRVTELLLQYDEKHPVKWIAACGPLPMLKALGLLMEQRSIPGELSLDSAMCCGVGACFACVTKIKDASSADGWVYRRICHDGPVFPANAIYWDN